jgi:hypothetical protein
VSEKWVAYGAQVYVDDTPQPWSYQKVSTLHACESDWPPEKAVEGKLDHNGTANILVKGLPLECGGASTEPTENKPVITEVNFPSSIYGDDVFVDGTVKFRDDNAGVNMVQFEQISDNCGGCVTGDDLSFDPEVTFIIEGWIGFAWSCTTDNVVEFTIQVTLQDIEGHVSEPEEFTIECIPTSIVRSVNTEFEFEEQGGISR